MRRVHELDKTWCKRSQVLKAGETATFTIKRAGRQHTVRCETEIKVELFEQCIHEVNQLDDELILPQIVAILEEYLRHQHT